MIRMTLLVMVACAACNTDSKDSPASGGGAGKTSVLDKIKGAGEKVGGALDKLDVDEGNEKLAAAKASLAKGLEASEECAWAGRVADDAVKDPVTELRKLCSFDVPLGRATAALAKAEAAKAEQPQAPSFTECSSDDWSSAKQKLDASPFAGEPRWTALEARWTKVCP